MEIRLEAAGRRLQLETKRMAEARRDPIVHIGPEFKNAARIALRDFHFDGKKRRIVDDNSDFFHRRNQEMLVTFPLKYGSEQLDQSRTPDRRFLIKPGPIGSDP